jgi:NAD+ synthase (glutamine-hydrolysing)
VIGPFELQDFNLYYITRYGYRPSTVAFLAQYAWGPNARDSSPEQSGNEYSLAVIKKWLEVFLYRFFELTQFKRSCLPNAPKVGSGGSLSPRSD